jgi:Leucine Rich Repeat.
MKNDKLKVLDLSWNRIGDPKMVTVTKLAQYFEKTNTLAHLDLSHCGFSDDELDMISKALTKNHSILGIHLNGNGNFNFSTNSLGYLEKEKISDMSKQILWNRIPTSSKNANKKMIEYKGSGGCYICEGWREIKFVWKNTKPDFDPGKTFSRIIRIF